MVLPVADTSASDGEALNIGVPNGKDMNSTMAVCSDGTWRKHTIFGC